MDNATQKENIADLYHRVSTIYGQVGPNFFAYAGQHLVERSGIAEGARVLDVAAGRGANLFPAARVVGPAGNVIGIDIAEGMVRETSAEIKRQGLHQASMMHMDAEHIAFPDASFDYVLCGFAIFLFPHLEQALSEFFRVLRPTGRVGITIGSNPGALSQWYGALITDYATRYGFPLNAGGGAGGNYEELPNYLTQAGFVDVQISYKHGDFAYANAQEWWEACWTHGTRYSLEHMPAAVLAQFKAEVFSKLAQIEQAGAIHETLDMKYIFAQKRVL